MNTKFRKNVILTKNSSELSVHLACGEFYKYRDGERYAVDGEFGRSGDRCGNDWHGEYSQMKAEFLQYIGEKVLDGYTVKSVDVVQG